MVRHVLLVASLAVSGLLAGFAVAATPQEGRDAFNRLDTDQNGHLVPQEMRVPCGTEVFAALDTNGDGQIEASEFRVIGKIAAFVDKGGVDTRNIMVRWLEFRVGDFNLDDQGIASCSVEEGQYPIDPKATAEEVETAKKLVRSQIDQARQASLAP